MIDTRQAAVELRQGLGHWEDDTVMGATGERDRLLILVERSTGLTLVIKLPHRMVRTGNRAVLQAIATSGPPSKTITWDNGTEFHGYRKLELAGSLVLLRLPILPVGARQQ